MNNSKIVLEELLYLNQSKDSLQGEIWKGIDLFEGFYEVSSLGRVRSTDYLIEANGGSYWNKSRILKQRLANCRELMVCISCAQLGFERKNYLVNRLVAIAFLPNPNNLRYAMHINDNNLDNRVDNLQWANPTECTRKDSAQGRRSKSLKEAKKGTMPNEVFLSRHDLALKNSLLARKRGVELKNDNQHHIFETTKEAEIFLNCSHGHIHVAIKRGNGIGRLRGYTAAFTN